jgi:hypothetical protein
MTIVMRQVRTHIIESKKGAKTKQKWNPGASTQPGGTRVGMDLISQQGASIYTTDFSVHALGKSVCIPSPRTLGAEMLSQMHYTSWIFKNTGNSTDERCIAS